MKPLRAILLASLLCLFVGVHVRAQGFGFQINYDDTQSSVFQDGSFAQDWIFVGEAGDLLTIRAYRIAGRFTPRLRLSDGAGNVLLESNGTDFNDYDELSITQGLPETGPYLIQVRAIDVISNLPENPAEYSLTLIKDGSRRANPNEGLSPLPDAPPIPQLETGDATRLNPLGINAYGAQDYTVQESNTSDVPARFTVSNGDFQLAVNNFDPIGQGVRSVTFLPNALGITPRINTRDIAFVSDEDFRIAYDSTRFEYRFTFADGRTILTDFYRVRSMRVLDGLLIVRMAVDDDAPERVLYFDNETVVIQRRGEGENVAVINEITFGADDQFIITDLAGFHTLAYLNDELRVLYDDFDGRIISDTPRLELRANHDVAGRYANSYAVETPAGLLRTVPLDLSWQGMGDVRITDNQLQVQPLDGRIITEPIGNVVSLVIEDAAVQIQRLSETTLLSLPDGTMIDSLTEPVANGDALPHESGYFPRGDNILGDTHASHCPCPGDLAEPSPINPATGNFYYAVQDFFIPSHTLALDFTRHYNSQDDGSTPAYMLENLATYKAGVLGNGWRHSYQYDLDIRYATQGELRLILPDGAQHRFSQVANSARFASATLPQWQIERVGERIGRWQATTTAGVIYYFDRAGRLERISEAPDRSLTFSPLPLTPQYTAIGTLGVFITEPYGRRIELYIGASGRIEAVRDTAARVVEYSYDAERLVGVSYSAGTIQASYSYDEDGILASFNDPRSAFHPRTQISYDARRRVLTYVENFDGTQPRRFGYVYDFAETGERRTSRSFTVSGLQRTTRWDYSQNFQLLRYFTPREGFDYEFVYDDNARLANYRTPMLTRFRVQYDTRGNLTQFTDPFSTTEQSYRFTYQERDGQSLLTEIRYPNTGVDTFTYSDTTPARLLTRTQLVSVGIERIERTTRYEYDDMGRLILLVEPGNIATLYHYDELGYVAEIWQGIVLEEGESAADITETARAQRILRLTYDIIGQIRRVTDGRGSVYTLNWDSSTEQLREISGPLGTAISFVYDEFGNVTLVEDRGQETLYTYNDLGLVDSVLDAQGAIITYTYDTAGNIISVVDDEQRETRYSYNSLNQPTQVVSAGGRVTTYTRTLTEERDFTDLHEVDPAGRTILSRFDALGRLRSYSITDGGEAVQDYRIEYNRNNWPTDITESISGRVMTIEYDISGQVQAINVGEQRTEFDYDLRGNLIAVRSPAGLETRYTYDPLGNIAQVQLPDESSYRYSYDEESNLISAIDPLQNTTRYTYNALNQVMSSLDPEFNEETFVYDERGNLITLIDAREIDSNFEYNALDQLTAIIAGGGQRTSFDYDPLGRLTNIARPGVRSTRLTYDADDNITAATERPREQRTLYSYSPLGQLNSISDPLGRTTGFVYDSIGRLRVISDAVGNEEQFEWRAGTLATFRDDMREYSFNTDGAGRITTIRDLLTEQNIAINTQFRYNADGFIESIQTGTDSARSSGNGDILHQVAYSPIGLPLTYTDPGGETWTFDYDAAGRLIGVIDPQSVETRYVRDGADRITQLTRYAGTPQETTELFEYDANGNVISYTAPDGVVNRYLYDQNNRLTQARLAVGSELESRLIFDYNDLGQLIRTQDAQGNETRYFYSLEVLSLIERDLGDETLSIGYSYDDTGNLRGIALPERRQIDNAVISISQTYDALNRRVRYVNGEDNVWAYTYDEAGNIAQVSDPLGSIVRYEYDTYDRVAQIIYPTGSTVALNYDIAGHIREVILPTNSSGTQQTITYELDIRGNVTAIREGASSTSMEYDELGRLLRRTLPDGRTIDYDYDAAGQLTETRYSDGTTITRSYDVAGRLTQLGNLTYAYDVLGRILRTATPRGDITYRYDLAGNVLQRDAGAFGMTETAYDSLNRPVEITLGDESLSIIYNNLDQIRQITRSNGVRTFINYDAAGRIISILHLGAESQRLDGFNYQYDAVGNLIRVDRLIDGSSIIYGYDVSHRLINERWLNANGETIYNVSFRYDAAGNRIGETRDGQLTTFSYDNRNQLTAESRAPISVASTALFPGALLLLGGIWLQRRRRLRAILLPVVVFAFGLNTFAQVGFSSDVNYSYDASGNLIEIEYDTELSTTPFVLELSYDIEGRLIAVSGQNIVGDAVNTRLTYDERSRLVRWQSADEDYVLFWDGDTLIGMQDQADENAPIEHYLSLNGQRLLTIRGDESLWHLNDQIGSTRRFADEAGALVTTPALQREFGSFGLRIFPSNNGEAPASATLERPTPLFAGHLYDPSTDLYIIGMRAYHPLTGRFLQPDPIRQDPIGTLYTYARNRPFVFSDETGLTAEPFLEPISTLASLPQLQPENLIPNPNAGTTMPQLMTPHLQSRDAVRVLKLVDTLRFGTNQSVGRLSPTLEDFYLFAVKTMPADQIALDAAQLRGTVALYEISASWQPTLAPQPFNQHDPFKLMGEVDGLLANAYNTPLSQDNAERIDRAILPAANIGESLPPIYQATGALQAQLQPVQVTDGLASDVAYITGLVENLPQPAPQMPAVTAPQAVVEPPILTELDWLRERTYDTRAMILPPTEAACQDCVRPLAFNR